MMKGEIIEKNLCLRLTLDEGSTSNSDDLTPPYLPLAHGL